MSTGWSCFSFVKGIVVDTDVSIKTVINSDFGSDTTLRYRGILVLPPIHAAVSKRLVIRDGHKLQWCAELYNRTHGIFTTNEVKQLSVDSRIEMQYNKTGKTIAEVADEMQSGKLKYAQTTNILNMTLLLRALAERRIHFEVIPEGDEFGYIVIPHIPDEIDRLLEN